MALVGEVVARFKAETGDYLAKIDAAKAKNKELAQQLLATAGSADKAIASLKVAGQKNALGDFGIDKRQVGGIVSAIKDIEKEAQAAQKDVKGISSALEESGQARAFHHITAGFESFARGDFLRGVAQIQKGMAHLEEGSVGAGVKLALTATIMHKVGEVTAEATRKAVELKRQYEAGAISAGELTEKLLASIPVIGGFWETGRNIRELLNLENHDLEKQIALQQELNELRAKRLEIDTHIREEAEHRQQQTDAIEAENEAKKLDLQGKHEDAQALRRKTKAETEARTQTADIEKEMKARYNELQGILTAKDKEHGDKTKGEQLSEAQKKISELQESIKQGEDLLNSGKLTGQGSSEAVMARVDEQKEALKQAQSDAANLDTFIKKTRDEQKLVNEDAIKAAVEARKKALGAGAGLDNALANKEQQEKAFKEFTKQFGEGLKEKLDAKGKPILDWIKEQFKEGQKQWEDFYKAAEKVKEALKTPADKLADELGMVNRLKGLKGQDGKPLLTDAEAKAFYAKNAKDLLHEQADILNSEHAVFSVPQVSELRAGQTLFQSPHTIEAKQLEKLQEIRDELKTLNKKAKEGSVDITVEALSL